jgi:dolichol-phosphate mannosyltransferase
VSGGRAPRGERRGRTRFALARAGQFVRFALVGVSGVAVNLAVFAATMAAWGRVVGETGADLGHGPHAGHRAAALVANAGGFVASVISNYALNRRWTFASRGPVIREMPRFLVVSLVGYALQLGAFWAGLVLLPIGRTANQLVAIACVMPFNFLANRFWSFERRGRTPSDSEGVARAA